MKVAQVTRWILLITILVLTIYDSYAFVTGGTEATISWITAEWAYKMPAGVFGIGFICGHLFWQMKPKEKGLK
jgi:hypothetical protein